MEAGQRNQNPKLRAGFPEEMTKKEKMEPRMVRFEPLVLMSRLREKLRMRFRTDELQKGKTVHLQRSFPHLAGG